MGSSTDTHRSPCPPLPKLPEFYPSSSLFPADHRVREASKNTSAAYSTELITKCAQVNDAHLAPAPRPNAPTLISGLGLLTASEVPPVAEYPQLAMPQQVGFYAFDVAARPVPEMTINGEASDNLYAQFDGWQPGSLSLPAPVDSYNAYLPTSLPAPVVSHPVNNALVPASLPSPMVSYAVDNAPVPGSFPSPMLSYTVDNASIPTPAILPPYEVHYSDYTANNAPFEYGGYGYTTEATSFGTLFNFSNPASFATPGIDVGVYPRTVDIDRGYQSYSYATTATTTTGAHSGTSGFEMQGFYV